MNLSRGRLSVQPWLLDPRADSLDLTWKWKTPCVRKMAFRVPGECTLLSAKSKVDAEFCASYGELKQL